MMFARRFVCSAVVLTCAAMAVSAAGHPLQGPNSEYSGRVRVLATPPAYPENTVDDVRRPGGNGRLWIGRGFIGDPEGKYPREYPQASGSPGPAAYGAFEDDYSQAYVRVGETFTAVSAWEAIPGAGYQRLERGRIAWLRERGFEGGVRTFTNPVYRRGEPAAVVVARAENKLPEPRIIFEVPPEATKFKKRQEVNAAPVKAGNGVNRAHTIVVVRSKDEPAAGPAVDEKGQGQVVVKAKAPERAVRVMADASKR